MEETKLNFRVKKSEPLMIIISGISGAGKDTVINRLMEKPGCNFHFVVTCNTRPMREGEKDGVDYHFVSEERFKKMIEQNELVEYAHVYDTYKGVPKSELEKGFAEGKDMIMRLDFQGMHRVKEFEPNALSIFIIPPDNQTWLSRLKKRDSDKQESTQIRINTAAEEINHIPEFDYLVVNDDIDKAVDEILMIIHAEHFRTTHRKVELKSDGA